MNREIDKMAIEAVDIMEGLDIEKVIASKERFKKKLGEPLDEAIENFIDAVIDVALTRKCRRLKRAMSGCLEMLKLGKC